MRGGNGEEKGREKSTRCQLIFHLTEVGGEGNYSAQEDNLIQLSQHQPRKSAIYGLFS